MTLPASGVISMNQVNVELGQAGTTGINMGAPVCRTLAGAPASGAISMSDFYGEKLISVVQRRQHTTTARVTTSVLSGWTPAVAGNLLIVEFLCGQANAPAPATPAGWTSWVGNVDAGNGLWLNVFWKQAAGGETGVSITHGNNLTCSNMREFSGWSNLGINTTVGATNAAPNPPSANYAEGKIVVAGCEFINGTITAFSPGYSNGIQVSTSVNGVLTIGSAEKVMGSDPEDPGPMAISLSVANGAFAYGVI